MTEWIKCSDRMPEEMQTVLFFDKYDTGDTRIKCGWWSARSWRPNAEVEENGFIESITPNAVSHWMPLPELPEVE